MALVKPFCSFHTMRNADEIQDREAIEALIRRARQDRDAALGRAMIDVGDSISRWIDATGRLLNQASRVLKGKTS